MDTKIDLLENYPRTRRDVKTRGAEKTEKDYQTARRFGKEFFDGAWRHGYGGFSCHPRFWQYTGIKHETPLDIPDASFTGPF